MLLRASDGWIMDKDELDFTVLHKKPPHWSREVFQSYGLSLGAVAKALGLSYSYVCGMLSGNIAVTPVQEERIRQLVKYIEKT